MTDDRRRWSVVSRRSLVFGTVLVIRGIFFSVATVVPSLTVETAKPILRAVSITVIAHCWTVTVTTFEGRRSRTSGSSRDLKRNRCDRHSQVMAMYSRKDLRPREEVSTRKRANNQVVSKGERRIDGC